jgi:acyl carrier protein
VLRAVVLMRPDPQGENRLVAYYTCPGGPPPIHDLRRHLAVSLPDYMVPTAWVALDAFPMNNDGWKINRKALPEPADAEEERDFVAPRTSTEVEVARCFTDVLGVRQIGPDDSFFELGGNSLQALRVVSRINKAFKIRISVRQLYGSATLAGIAGAIDELIQASAHA